MCSEQHSHTRHGQVLQGRKTLICDCHVPHAHQQASLLPFHTSSSLPLPSCSLSICPSLLSVCNSEHTPLESGYQQAVVGSSTSRGHHQPRMATPAARVIHSRAAGRLSRLAMKRTTKGTSCSTDVLSCVRAVVLKPVCFLFSVPRRCSVLHHVLLGFWLWGSQPM